MASDLVRLESKLESARRRLSYFQTAAKYIYSWVPNDCFLTLVLVIALVFTFWCVVIKCMFEFFQESLVGSVVNLSLFDLRNRFYRNAIHLDIGQIERQGTSELMARFTNDMDALGTGVKTLFGKVVAEPLKALSCIVMACFISWQLTLMFLILVPIAALILTKVGRLMKQATRRLLERMSSIYKILQESFQGIRVVKAFTMEPYERRRFHTATKDYFRRSMQVVKLDALTGPIIEILGVAAVAAALLAGSYLVLQRETKLFGMKLTTYPLEAESLLQLYVLLAAIADPVRKLSSVFTRIQSGGAAADRIFAFLDRQPERWGGNTNGPRLHRQAGTFARTTAGAAELEDDDAAHRVPRRLFLLRSDGTVATEYQPQGSPRGDDRHRGAERLRQVDAAGPAAALLRPRFRQRADRRPRSAHGSPALPAAADRPGHAGDVPVRRLDLQQHRLRRTWSQAGRGRSGSALGRRPRLHRREAGRLSTSDRRGRQPAVGRAKAAHRVGASDPARSQHPDPGRIHERRRPRRARRRSIAVQEFKRGRTTFIITHEMQSLEMADRIIVLEDGRMAAVGTHAELLANCAMYQRLQQAQSQRLVA